MTRNCGIGEYAEQAGYDEEHMKAGQHVGCRCSGEIGWLHHCEQLQWLFDDIVWTLR